ncbi:MAG: alginate O-acetyltransferase AlgF [Ignavibacteria bacterium]
MRGLHWLFVAILATGTAQAMAETPLYETGPAQDAAFVRILNATGQKVVVASASGNLSLDAEGSARASRFYAVAGGATLRASVQRGAATLPVEVKAGPGEFVTLALLPAGAERMQTRVIRERDTDFSAVRASLALFNLDPECAAAQLRGGKADQEIVAGVTPAGMARRMVNPVKLAVRALCDGKAAAGTLDLPPLAGGDRYSVFVVRSRRGREAFFVQDSH